MFLYWPPASASLSLRQVSLVEYHDKDHTAAHEEGGPQPIPNVVPYCKAIIHTVDMIAVPMKPRLQAHV